MHHVSCTNTPNDVIDLENHVLVKNTKTWISWERNITFLRNKKILNLCLIWRILRGCCFVAEVIFKCQLQKMVSCFCGIVDRRKVFRLISSRDNCQRSSPSRISDTPWAGFEPAQNLSSGFVEWSCAVVITTTPRRHIHWNNSSAVAEELFGWVWSFCGVGA